MKHIIAFMLSIALLLISFKAIELGRSEQRADANKNAAAVNRKLIQQSNRQMARKIMAIREERRNDLAPADLEGFVILEEK